jgi:hypothetical protein
MTTVTERFEAANDISILAAVIESGIEHICANLAKQGVFVDNGIAVIPYEILETEEDKHEAARWELAFVRRATALAYTRWAHQFSQ